MTGDKTSPLLSQQARELMMELVRSHAPEAAVEMENALARTLNATQAGVLKGLAQSELLRSGFEGTGEPTGRGLLLEEIINALYRQFPSK